MELSTQVLTEFLSMVRGNKAKAKARSKAVVCRCLQCDKEAASGCRGLCSYHFSQFKSDKEKVALAVVALTKKEQQHNITLDQKREQAKEDWDDAQVSAGRIFKSRRGRHPKSPSPFTKTA